MSVGVGMSRAVISSDGTCLAYIDGGTIGNAWRVPILDDAPTTWAEAEQLTFDRDDARRGRLTRRDAIGGQL